MGEPARAAVERYVRDGRPGFAAKHRRPVVESGRKKLDAGIANDRSSLQPPTSDLRPRASGALFLNRSGGRLSQRAIQLIVRKYALAAGLDERVHPHLLRHTFATHLLDGGAELRVVQELLGHANPNTTQIYLHVTEERQRHVVEGSLDGIAEVEAARRALGRRGHASG